jgi:hypothetical protein
MERRPAEPVEASRDRAADRLLLYLGGGRHLDPSPTVRHFQPDRSRLKKPKTFSQPSIACSGQYIGVW